MNNNTPYANKWESLDNFLKDISDEKVGRLLKEYIAESIHEGWQGIPTRDHAAIRRMLVDFATYVVNV